MSAVLVHSSITQTNCFDEIHAATKDLPKDALVIFDIDDVLITAKDHVLRGHKKEKWLNNYFDNQFSPEEVLQVSSHVWTVYETEITDTKVVHLNESLKTRGIPSIALTAGWNGSLGHRPLHCDDRVDILKRVGIDFSHSFPTMGETFFHPFENCAKTPSFKRGVIFACMLPKQDILGAFLASANYTPHIIIFVDDMLINLERLKVYCLANNIHYHGFYYTGVDARDVHPFDEEIAHLQFQTVIRDKRWLNDAEARDLLLLKKRA